MPNKIEYNLNLLKELSSKNLSNQQIADIMGLKESFVKKQRAKHKIKSGYIQKHSEETKSKISIIRKNFLKNNPDKHPWKKHTKFKSAPCEKVKEWLKSQNISFIGEFDINACDHTYSIDIAFPDKKIGIEINGNQHYNRDGTLKEYYKNRENHIENLGWKLYQIHYSICYKIDEFSKMLEFIKNSDNKIEFNYEEYVKIRIKKSLNKKIRQKRIIKIKENKIKIYTFSIKPKDLCFCGNYKLVKSKICKKCNNKSEKFNTRRVIRPSKEELIELIKHNSFLALSRKFGVSDNAIRKWCKYYSIDYKNL